MREKKLLDQTFYSILKENYVIDKENDPYLLAGLLVEYIKNLTVPLFGNKSWKECMYALEELDGDLMLEKFKEILLGLTTARASIVVVFLHFLWKTQTNFQENGSNSALLAAIFGYGMIRPPNSTSQKHNPKTLASIAYIIENFNKIVDVEEVDLIVGKIVSHDQPLDNEENISYIDVLLMKISKLENSLKNSFDQKSDQDIGELVDILSKLKSANSFFH